MYVNVTMESIGQLVLQRAVLPESLEEPHTWTSDLCPNESEASTVAR